MHYRGVKREKVILTTLKKLLRKYNADKATPAERRVVDIWYESFSEKEEASTLFNDVAERNDMQQRIWNNLPLAKTPRSWFQRNRYVLLGFSTAALLLLVFSWNQVLQYSGLVSETTTQSTPLAAFSASTTVKERKLITLPDSSRVWLNANSTLSVADAYGMEARHVTLEGEAFFDVAPDPRRPFVVKTKHIKIQVLGTAFNIQAYPSAEAFRVGVEHGKVAVLDNLGQQLNQLTKGQMLSYNTHDGKIFTKMDAAVGSWRDGRVVLEQASFADLRQAIYNIYGVRLRNERKSGNQYSYNLQIHANRSLAQTLDIVCDMHRLNYRRENDEIILY
ncbi:FecR family protein [Sphingobacterium bambusae]|uniref:FecR family protein n=1 Tax=Sphingobacterium bambusae TaxID=662858 RepID=UPI002A18C9AB|nr:FecR domain-containing protein [Sphingobacterium bambusae]WPL47043.1 FecR domain-containing protein [Sphingobacterium bambusae]